MFERIKAYFARKEEQNGYRWGLDVLVSTGGHPVEVADFYEAINRDRTPFGHGARKAVIDFHKLVTQVRAAYAKDKERLDKLDKTCGPIIEGQNYSWPYGEHVANNWSIEGPYSNIREAIDALP